MTILSLLMTADDDYVRPKFNVVSLKPSDSARVTKDARASRTPAPLIDSGACVVSIYKDS